MPLTQIMEDAVNRVGTVSELARRLGIRRTAFYRWKQVPSGRVIPLEKITGIHRSVLRPDLYPEDE